MSNWSTEQESFWSGDFGDSYIARNAASDVGIAKLLRFWSRSLQQTRNITSAIELGANIGLNLRALRRLLPSAHLAAVEINEKACAQLSDAAVADDIVNSSLFAFRPQRSYDLAFTSGVLIHIAPERLNDVYMLLNNVSSRYIIVSEYYNPVPMEITYRGHSNKLFKRDFAGDMLELFPHLRLVDYGFVYRRDPNMSLDDLTWFLLEKDTAG